MQTWIMTTGHIGKVKQHDRCVSAGVAIRFYDKQAGNYTVWATCFFWPSAEQLDALTAQLQQGGKLFIVGTLTVSPQKDTQASNLIINVRDWYHVAKSGTKNQALPQAGEQVEEDDDVLAEAVPF